MPEIVATLLGIANIALLVRRSIWNYPFGLAMVAIYAWIFAGAKLYSDALLQLFFFVIQLYGWWAWARAGGDGRAVTVERLSGAARLGWLGAGLVGTIDLSRAELDRRGLPYAVVGGRAPGRFDKALAAIEAAGLGEAFG